MKSPSLPSEPVHEEFSLPLFAFTVTATLAGLFLLVRLISPAVWEAQLIAPAWQYAAVFAAVSMMACFFEFFFHRYLLHMPVIPGLQRLYRQHTLHHALTRIGRRPMQDGRQVMVVENVFPITQPEQGEGSFFPWYSLAVFSVVLTPVFALMQWLMPNYPWFVGGFLAMTSSITLYEVWHAINHWDFAKWEPLISHRTFGWFWRPVYSFHLRHHAVIACNESVSGFFGLPVADWVFGTCLMPKTIYADGEEWKAENFTAPRPRRFIRWLDTVATDIVNARRAQSREDQSSPLPERTYTRGEEIANWLTHGIGAVLSVVALTLLIVFASAAGDAWHVVSFTVFGLTLLVLYTVSTLYHLSRSERRRWLFRRLDHAAVFLLIAGTYTPFLLTNLRGPWGWTLFGVVWGLCVAGATFKFFFAGRFQIASTVAYLFAGWLIVVAIKPLAMAVPAPAIWLLIGGGLFYSGGVVFYLWKRLRYHHAFWHGFVMSGSTCHVLAVLLFLTPQTS